MNFKNFVRAKAKGQIRDGTLVIYDKDRQQLTGRLGPRPLRAVHELGDIWPFKWKRYLHQRKLE